MRSAREIAGEFARELIANRQADLTKHVLRALIEAYQDCATRMCGHCIVEMPDMSHGVWIHPAKTPNAIRTDDVECPRQSIHSEIEELRYELSQ